ncbi:MAG: sugar phosphate isomerase/epimerase family protein [Bryobacteraceae bacterium]
MYLSLQRTLTAGRLPWREFARLAHYIGYPGVDVMLEDAMADGAESTAGLFATLNLRPAVVGFPVQFRKDDAAFEADFPKLEPAAKFAAAIGCPRMTTWIPASDERPKAELRRIYKTRFVRSAGILAKHGVRLGLEFISPLHLRKAAPHEFIYRMDEMLEFVREIGPNAGLLLDSWHWHHAGATPADIEKAGKDRIVHVQVADAQNLPADQIKDNERLMPGEGIVDWKGFFGALRRIGYRDGISPEVFGRGLKDISPDEGAQLGYSTTIEVLQKVGIA